MAYDPQAKRQRPKPALEGPAPVDALLLNDEADAGSRKVVADASRPTANVNNDESPLVAEDPPPAPTVTPEPANPPPDKLLLNSALIGTVAALIGALALRFMLKRGLSRVRKKKALVDSKASNRRGAGRQSASSRGTGRRGSARRR